MSIRRKYCDDETRLMLCAGDKRNAEDYDLETEVEELLDAHNRNIYMKGATDALEGLVNLLIHHYNGDPQLAIEELINRVQETPGDFAELCLSHKNSDDEAE